MHVVAPEQLPSFTVGAYGLSPFRLGFTFYDRQRAALTPDGSRIWYTGYPALLELSIADGLVHRRMSAKNTLHHRLVFACDGTLIVQCEDELWWVDDERRTVSTSVSLRAPYNSILAASPTEPRRCALVTTYGAPSPLIVDATEGAATAVIQAASLATDDGPANSIAFTADGSEVLIAYSLSIQRFDARTGASLGALFDARRPGSPLASIRRFVALDAQRGLVLGNVGDVLVIDLGSGVVLARASLGEPLAHLSNPSGRGRVVVASTGVAYVLDARDLQQRAVIRGDFDLRDGTDILVSPRDERAWLLDYRGAIHGLSLEDGALKAHAPACYPVEVAWRGETLVVTRMLSPTEEIDLRTGASRLVPMGEFTDGPVLSATAERVFAQSDRARVGCWRDLSDGSTTEPIAIEPLRFIAGDRCWGFSAKQQCLVTEGRSIALGEIKSVHVMTASPSARRALVASKSEALIVDLEAGAVLARYKLLSAQFARFITEDEVLVVGSKGAQWIEALTGVVLARSGKMIAERAAVSQDGTIVAIAAGIGHCAIVTRDRPDDVVSFTGGSHPRALAFSPDNKRLAVAGNESVVRVFDVDAALATRAEPKKRAKRKK